LAGSIEDQGDVCKVNVCNSGAFGEGMRLDDPTQMKSDMDQDPSLKALLRLASTAFPAIVAILSLLLCWRAHFSRNSLGASVLAIAFSAYLAIYFYRRSRGLSANAGYGNPGPDRDWSYNDQSDIGALWAAAIFIAVLAYMAFKQW
jgi:hypothetical protein